MSLIKTPHQKSILLLANPLWVYDEPASANQEPWSITSHVIFKNQRNHKSLAFALEYFVSDLTIQDLLIQSSYVRVIICYGDQVGVMLNSINLFLVSHPKTTVYSGKASELMDKHRIEQIANQLLKQKLNYAQVQISHYIPPFHKTQLGQWEVIEHQALLEVNH